MATVPPIDLGPFRRVKDVHFAGNVWYCVFTTDDKSNSGDDIYLGTGVSPWWQADTDTVHVIGYRAHNYTIQKATLHDAEEVNTELYEVDYGSEDTAPTPVGSVSSDIAAEIAAIQLGVLNSLHRVSGPTTSDGILFEGIYDDGSLTEAKMKSLLIGKCAHIRVGDDPTNDPSTDFAASNTGLVDGDLFFRTGDGHFNRGSVNYIDITGSPILGATTLSTGTQYTLLMNQTPGIFV